MHLTYHTKLIGVVYPLDIYLSAFADAVGDDVVGVGQNILKVLAGHHFRPEGSICSVLIILEKCTHKQVNIIIN